MNNRFPGITELVGNGFVEKLLKLR